MNEIDYKKLAEQEPEFAEYASRVLFQVFTKTNKDFLMSMHQFYKIGMTEKQAVDYFVSLIREGQKNG